MIVRVVKGTSLSEAISAYTLQTAELKQTNKQNNGLTKVGMVDLYASAYIVEQQAVEDLQYPCV
jgi:hypothetical protein